MARKKLQKVFALLLTASMTMSLLSVTAFADELEEHAHNPVTCPTCGGDHQIEVDVTCPACDGEVAEVPMVSCGDCDGTGIVYGWNWDTPCPNNGYECTGCDDCFSGFAKIPEDCEACGGTGKVQDPNAEVCEACGGKGTIQQPEECPDCTDGNRPLHRYL